jgi:hypothetical protein
LLTLHWEIDHAGIKDSFGCRADKEIDPGKIAKVDDHGDVHRPLIIRNDRSEKV